MISSVEKRKILTLVITEECNLNCVYCYQYSKSHKVMPIDLAKQEIREHLNSNDDFSEIEIELLGGEPFMRKAFIKELVNWTIGQNFHKPYVFFASTNGTRIHGDIQNWLRENKKYIVLGLSIDGLPDTQNKNRSNSYNDIDLMFFKELYPFQPVKMTINEYTLLHLSDNIVHLHSLGFEVDAAFAQGIKWNIEESRFALITELKKLIDFYLENPEIQPFSLLNQDLSFAASKYKIMHDYKRCGCGTEMVCIDINGNEYPCHLFLPSSMRSDDWKNFDLSKEEMFVSEECSNCLINNMCTTCIGINLRERNNINSRDNAICEFNKITALATSYLVGKRINFDNNNNYTDTLNGIIAIQHEYAKQYSL